MITGYTPYKANCVQPIQTCPTQDGCPTDKCPDFEIKRFDVMPPYRISVSDCNGPLDLTGCIAEVSMWARAKLKTAVATTDEYFALADNVGFEQANVGDIIVVDRARNPEQMLITGFDEVNKLVQIQRGYNGTTIDPLKKGQRIRIFRVLNAIAEVHAVTEDITDVNTNEVAYDVVTDSQLVYNWQANDTCLPGCYWMEFKLLKMLSSSLWDTSPLQMAVSVVDSVNITPSIIPSFITSISSCALGDGVEWVRRFPLEEDGFLIKINESFTAENVI